MSIIICFFKNDIKRFSNSISTVKDVVKIETTASNSGQFIQPSCTHHYYYNKRCQTVCDLVGTVVV